MGFYSTSIYAAVGPEAGGLVSTANDLLKLLSVATGYTQSPLAPSMSAMLSARRPIAGNSEQALGWVVLGKGDDQLITHEGSTWGYSSYLAWDPRTRVGVVVLSNQLASVGDIALHLLRPKLPLAEPKVMKHTEITLDSALLDTYMGQYQVKEEGPLKIIQEHDFLTIQLPISWGLPKFRLRPESQSDFFVAELPIRVSFVTNNDGRVTGLLLYPPRGQQAMPAQRMESDK